MEPALSGNTSGWVATRYCHDQAHISPISKPNIQPQRHLPTQCPSYGQFEKGFRCEYCVHFTCGTKLDRPTFCLGPTAGCVPFVHVIESCQHRNWPHTQTALNLVYADTCGTVSRENPKRVDFCRTPAQAPLFIYILISTSM